MIRCGRMVKLLGICLFVSLAPGCGSSSSTSSGSGGGGISLAQRQAAAEATVKDDNQCTTLTPFYWEVGDGSGALDSGSGGDNSGTPPNSATVMAIASASKWIFGAYALEKLDASTANPLTADEVALLNFTSGYDNMSDASCFLQDTVGGCFGATNPAGGLNSDRHSSDAGRFFYNGGHMQAMAVNDFALGGDYISFIAPTPKLATGIEAYVGQDLSLYYSNPSLAGGADTTPAIYARFLQKILNGDLRMKDYLDADAVCAHANSTDCPTAIYSPINQAAPGLPNDVSDEAWHYSIGHWIEDDPQVGDGAFSSPGADGFYPWIDASKSYYGILARFDSDPTAAPGKEPYVLSVHCGRKIRKAWLTGQEQ